MEEKRDWEMCRIPGCNDCDVTPLPSDDHIALRGGATPGRRASVILSLLAGMSALGGVQVMEKDIKADLRNPGENNHQRPCVSARPRQERKHVDFKKLIKKKKKEIRDSGAPGFHERNISALFRDDEEEKR